MWLYYRQLPGVTTDENGCALGPKLVRLDETGIHQTDDRHTGSSRWSGVLEVRDEAGHVFLMIDRYAAYIVPKRSFQTADDVTRFVAFARERSLTHRRA